MSFISYPFLLLFACVWLACWRLPFRWVNPCLLLASYVFYGWWDWRFLGLLVFSSVVDFVCGRLLDGRVSEERRSDVLIISLVVNLGTLAVFKYFDFFIDSFSEVLSTLGIEMRPPLLRLVLPIGISFYTFQTLSYTIDVYRRKMPSADRFLDFLLYVSFFPQLVAGPIERATSLLPQIQVPRTFNWERISSGCQLALVGFFKKMVIADNLAPFIESVYGNGGESNGLAVVLATYAFAIQIYCDFSGYTDIARGVARMIGFELCENFNLPYFATNPSDFWRRWHISLSTWIRDYLYIPLGGSRGGRFRVIRNLVITMFLAGLWHGASWNFVIWGLYHGVLLGIFAIIHDAREKQQRARRPQLREPNASGVGFWLSALAFFHLTCLGWLIFRAESLSSILKLLKSISEVWHWSLLSIDPNLVFRLVLFGIPLILFQCYQFKRGDNEPWIRWRLTTRVAFYVALFYGIVLLGSPERHEFIYFQF
ncbi:Peptidoglycan O-acetyltransferase [Stieleria neptunia]|uniref:Peptidoglycan O-acetyltransferase n=1 Tax=Stieleria neptunia TaxID=2527979 RepID=A0A518HRT4_9BACT|nr:MBOAT family O-acyltransferase [Stieleria neptunia]QDV43557.1 Peptidoglycan O-acetyltransferase [Stieleria neptunia]